MTQDIKIFKWMVFSIEDCFDFLKTCESNHNYKFNVVGLHKICRSQIESPYNVFSLDELIQNNNAANLANILDIFTSGPING